MRSLSARIPIRIFKTKAGEVSPEPCWCCIYSCHMHLDDTLFGLLFSVITEWKDDVHLVG